MPCYDPDTAERPRRLEEKVHWLTSLLCELCEKVEKSNPALLEGDSGIQEWWRNHKAHDERIALLRKNRAEFGAKSLTNEEYSALWCADDVSY